MIFDRTYALFDLIRSDPVAGVRQCRERVQADRAGFQRAQLMRVAEAALATRRFKEDYQAWRSFLKEPYFGEERKLKKHSDATYTPFVAWAVMQYAFNVEKDNKAKSNRTWKYVRVVEFQQIDELEPESIADAIERGGGIEKLCRQAAKEDPRQDRQALLQLRTISGGSEGEKSCEQGSNDADGQSTFGYEEEKPDEERYMLLVPLRHAYALQQAEFGERVQATLLCKRDDDGGTVWIVDSADPIG